MGHQSPNDLDNGVLGWNVSSTRFTLPYLVAGDEVRVLQVFDQWQEGPDSWF